MTSETLYKELSNCYELVLKKRNETVKIQLDVLSTVIDNEVMGNQCLSDTCKILVVSTMKHIFTDETLFQQYKNILDEKTTIFLKNLLFNGVNKFLTVCTRDCIFIILKAPGIAEMKSLLLSDLYDQMEGSSLNLSSVIAIMEIFIKVLSKNMTKFQNIKEKAVKLLESNWKETINNYIFHGETSTNNSTVEKEYATVCCLILWKKILKTLQTNGNLSFSRQSQIICCLRTLLEKIELIPKHCYCNAIDVLRTSIKVKTNEDVTTNNAYTYLQLLHGKRLTTLMNTQIPGGFLGSRNLNLTKGLNDDKLRQKTMLLCLNCCCTCFGLDCLKGNLQVDIERLSMVHHCTSEAMSGLQQPLCASLITMYQDQDDYLIEVLFSLLQVYLVLSKHISQESNREKSDHPKKAKNSLDDNITEICKEINPHLLFLHFLQNTNWDYSLLLDFIISPETDFLVYFTKYLRHTVDNWCDLLHTCSIFRLCDLNEDSSDHTHQAECLSIKTKEDECEENTLSKTSNGMIHSNYEMDEKPNDCDITKKIVSMIQHKDENETEMDKANIKLVCYSESESDAENESLIEENTANVLHKTNFFDGNPETSMHGIKTFSPDPAVSESHNIETSLLVVSTTTELHREHINIDNLETTVNRSLNSNVSTNTTVLDKYMAVLIRLGLKIERMIEQNIFPFEAEPLLYLINECEHIYEAE